ncbi:Smr/MutS family protein [Candidatus Uhrbacteria bacterium]|nr:Smr/MutS family protein [Candidatus Uhrbacteria bacterium]
MKEKKNISPPEANKHQEQEILIFSAELGTPPQIDLHANDAHEACGAVDRFLNDQFMAGERVGKIIHGRGTGKLREAVHHLLQDHPLVEYYRDAQALHAVGGVTYVVLSRKA